MSKGLNELRDEARANAVAKGFPDASVAERIALIHSELSEALEDHRAGMEPHIMVYQTPGGDFVNRMTPPAGSENMAPYKPCGIPSEIADVIIRALDFCGAYGIDIERAVGEKMTYNTTRPHKHGGKVL